MPLSRLVISIADQLLSALDERGEVARSFPISSSKYGTGSEEGSFRTPTGEFKICQKIGGGHPLGTIFKSREARGLYDFSNGHEGDLILSRILWLEGLEESNANTRQRFIYLHGTNQEELIGQAASIGCIRLRNQDIIELYDLLETGLPLSIVEDWTPSHMKKFLFLDCDSTLSAIEGIDELARLKDDATFAQVEELTNQAMNGEVPINEIFARRLELIRPTADECAQVGSLYIQEMPEGLEEALAAARKCGWTPVIISGGFLPCIAPLAKHLGIAEVHAVPLHFHPDGSYAGFEASPTTRNGGKPEIIRQRLAENEGARSVMVGDGISDQECASDVDRFIACFTFVERSALAESSPYILKHFSELGTLLGEV